MITSVETMNDEVNKKRLKVSEEKINWHTKWSEYEPNYTSKSVLNNPDADPNIFDS